MRYHPASVPETLPVSTGGHWASKSSGLSGTNNAGSAVTAATSLRLKNSTAVLLISGSSSKYVFMISNSRPVAPLDFTKIGIAELAKLAGVPEEWFQYEGEPGHFHIILDVTNQKITADYAAIIRAVKMYKRLSAHMDELTYQGQVHGVIYTNGEYFRYKTPLTGRLKAGTHPQRNTRGSIGAGTFVVGTEAAGFIFNAPAAGTKPYRNTIFANQTTHIDAETALNAFGYTNTPAGRIRAGESPQRNTRGQTDGAAVTMGDTAEAYHFTTPAAGTVPERSTVQRTEGGTVGSSTQAMGYSYGVKPCGSTRKL